MTRSKALLFVAIYSIGVIAYGAANVFEKGDALYRPKKSILGIGFLFGHAGIYLNSQSTYGNDLTTAAFAANQLPNIISDGKHSVIQAPGYFQGGVQVVPFASFLGSESYWGAYETPGLTSNQRYKLVQAAGENLQKDYTLFSGWKGTGSPAEFRCDGLVSFAYAQAGAPPIPENPGSWATNFPRTQRNQIQRLNGGDVASARAPICGPATASVASNGFALSIAQVKDDVNGSGIDRVEFYNGQPESGGIPSWRRRSRLKPRRRTSCFQ